MSQTKRTINYWSVEEDSILQLNTNKISYLKMQQFLPNRTISAIKQRAKGLGLKNNFRNCETRCHNENFWETPNLINSYWAGFMCADGSVGRYGGNRARFACGLSVNDKNHLQLFLDTVQSNHVMIKKKHQSPSSNNICESVHIAINSAQKWLEDLEINFNIVPNKTLRIGPPNIYKDELLFAFLAGYTDGDGCISKINDGRVSMVWVSSSHKMLEWVANFIDQKFSYQVGKQSFLPTTSSDICERWGINGYKSAIVFNYMQMLPIPKLDRKWKQISVIEAVDKYKQKKPALFDYSNLPTFDDYLKYI